jgi:DNA-binding MarR family transcriptional regulator
VSNNSQDVLISLRQIIRAADLHSKKLIREVGLTTPQILVLQAANRLQKVTIRKISDEISLSQATVTTILNRLEQKELVCRVRSQTDKRAVHVELTEEGLRALDTAPNLLMDEFVERFERLESWEQNLILSTLQRIAKMMKAEDIDAAPLLDIGSPMK